MVQKHHHLTTHTSGIAIGLGKTKRNYLGRVRLCDWVREGKLGVKELRVRVSCGLGCVDMMHERVAVPQ